MDRRAWRIFPCQFFFSSRRQTGCLHLCGVQERWPYLSSLCCNAQQVDQSWAFGLKGNLNALHFPFTLIAQLTEFPELTTNQLPSVPSLKQKNWSVSMSLSGWPAFFFYQWPGWLNKQFQVRKKILDANGFVKTSLTSTDSGRSLWVHSWTLRFIPICLFFPTFFSVWNDSGELLFWDSSNNSLSDTSSSKESSYFDISSLVNVPACPSTFPHFYQRERHNQWTQADR